MKMRSARQEMLEKDKTVSVDRVVCQDCREIPKSARIWSLYKSLSSFLKQPTFQSSIALSVKVG